MTITADSSGFGTNDGVRPLAAELALVERIPGLAIAGVASVAAGVVHAGAIGIHAEHPQLARIFVTVAALQLGAGLIAFARPRRLVAAIIAGVNAAAVTGWVLTRITGISWIDGLESAESPQFTDTICALLGVIALGTAVAAAVVGWQRRRPVRLALPAFAAVALAVTAMMAGATHAHSGSDDHSTVATGETTHGDDDAAAAPNGATPVVAATENSDGHDESGDHHDTATTEPATTEPATDGAMPPATDAGHGHEADPVEAANAAWPRPWDPTAPIDVSGVTGVSAEQEERARNLIEASLKELPRYATTEAAIADGYTSIGDAGTGTEHYIKLSIIQDDVMLDATQPESLVYAVDGDKRTLTGAMYIASARPTDDSTLTDWAGPLMQWHNHGNLCWDRDASGTAKVVGIVDANGVCARGVNTGGENPMVHVWITPHECGVFAALEGVGAGQTSVSESERVDKCQSHEKHEAEAPEPVPYDPTKPIDLGGVPGVTPEQQAAAENLVAVNIVRLPQWSDYKVAEAAGFHSIGDGITGTEHFVQWDWINDDVWLDPDHPESLVYQPQPDGSKKLLSAMYMLPTSVDLSEVPDIGGALMQWHIHDNLCYTPGAGTKVAGLTDANGNCTAPLVKHDPAAMIHVWITPHPCGPFAALEGVGAGQIEDGETRLCDHAHGST